MDLKVSGPVPLHPLPGAGRAPEGAAPAKRAFSDVLDVVTEGHQSARASPTQPIAPPTTVRAEAPSAAAALLETSFRSEDRLDAIIRAAGRGKTFTAGELLALQAEVFRHSQVVEVVSRTLDRVVGGIKQVLGTQV